MTNTILITGGAGNVGSALANKLSENNDNFIVIVDNLSTGSLSKVPNKENVIFIKANTNIYNDIVPIFGRYNFGYVFHYAAVVGVKRTLESPMMVLEDIEGIKNILSLSKNAGVKRVFYSSSSEVYGEPFEIPQNEKTTPLNSRLPYAIVKNVGEAFFKSYYQEYGLEYTIFRFFNTYGPNQSDDFVVPRFIKAALKNEIIYLYGDGLQTRSFCYVDDQVEGIYRLLLSDYHLPVNIGNPDEITIKDFADEIIKLTGTNQKVVYQDLPMNDPLQRQPDTTKAREILGWEAKVSREEGMKITYDYFKSLSKEELMKEEHKDFTKFIF